MQCDRMSNKKKRCKNFVFLKKNAKGLFSNTKYVCFWSDFQENLSSGKIVDTAGPLRAVLSYINAAVLLPSLGTGFLWRPGACCRSSACVLAFLLAHF